MVFFFKKWSYASHRQLNYDACAQVSVIIIIIMSCNNVLNSLIQQMRSHWALVMWDTLKCRVLHVIKYPNFLPFLIHVAECRVVSASLSYKCSILCFCFVGVYIARCVACRKSMTCNCGLKKFSQTKRRSVLLVATLQTLLQLLTNK